MAANSSQSCLTSESAAVNSDDWRFHLLPESRERVVAKITDILKMHIPYSDEPDTVLEIKDLASRFEEKIFSSATNQTDYLRKISMKLISVVGRNKQ